MEIDHNTLVAFAKSGGLFYFIAFSVGVIVYTFWPSNRKKFDRAKHKVLNFEGGPEIASEDDDEPSTPEDPACR